MTQQNKLTANDILIPSPIGNLELRLSEGKLSSIKFSPETEPVKPPTEKNIQEIAAEINAYFSNPHHHFTLAFQLQGTPFQKSVWKALQQIPCGKTVSYQALAQQLKTSPRAIGNACRKNPLPLVIPCHRVVSKTGLGGFCGETRGKLATIKQTLLQHESHSAAGAGCSGQSLI